MTINLLDRRNRDTDLAALTSRHNASNLPPSSFSPSFVLISIQYFWLVIFDKFVV